MKVSKYTLDIPINRKKAMLYNMLSRRYYTYNIENRDSLRVFLDEINKGEYTDSEIKVFRQLVANGIIVRDSVDELKKLEFLETSARYQEYIFKITIYATNACNFRCSYCEQKHEAHSLTDEAMETILRCIEKMSQKVRCIEVDWFGGEPLLEHEKIEYFMKKAKEICSQNSCELFATVTTNGYLLNEKMLGQMGNDNVRAMQITVDGNRITHNSRRRLLSDGETFDVIMRNINAALRQGICITLRINIDEQNKSDISEVLDEIMPAYRSHVYVSISNIFQNKQTVSTYPLLLQAMQKGFLAHDRWNHYVHCHACLKNAVIVDTDGNVLLCSNTSDEEKRMGYLKADGDIYIERVEDYYKIKTLSARDNSQCQDCIELPYCIASCKYQRMRTNDKCLGVQADGLSLNERALLDYYYDQFRNASAKKAG